MGTRAAGIHSPTTTINMKAKLLVSQSGLAAGATYEIDGQPGLRNALLKNGDVSVSVPLADLVIEAPAPAPVPERAAEPEAPAEQFPGFQPHEQRVLAEYVELSDHIDKLHGFLADDSKIASLDRETIDGLSNQHRAMLRYQDALFARIEKFGGGLVVDAPPVKPEPFSEPLPDHVYIDEINEDLARGFYDEYCEAVGGKAFNGDPLPPAEEFFVDPAKARQANAYRAAVAKMVPPESYRSESDDREPGAPRFPQAVAVLQREIETLANNEPIARGEGRESDADFLVGVIKELHGAVEALTLDDAPGLPASVADEPEGNYSEQTELDDDLDRALEESQSNSDTAQMPEVADDGDIDDEGNLGGANSADEPPDEDI